MAPWETDPALASQSVLMADFANLWQAADKVVYSTTLDAVSTAKTGLERNFDPASVRDMKASATSDLSVGGPHLAAHAVHAGLVDECHLFIRPVVVGGGKPALPSDTRADLELLDGRRLSNGRVPPLPHRDLSVHGHQPRREHAALAHHPNAITAKSAPMRSLIRRLGADQAGASTIGS